MVFRGGPHMCYTVIRLFEVRNKSTVYGALSEEEGLRKLSQLNKAELIVIDGQYDEEQRKRF